MSSTVGKRFIVDQRHQIFGSHGIFWFDCCFCFSKEEAESHCIHPFTFCFFVCKYFSVAVRSIFQKKKKKECNCACRSANMLRCNKAKMAILAASTVLSIFCLDRIPIYLLACCSGVIQHLRCNCDGNLFYWTLFLTFNIH